MYEIGDAEIKALAKVINSKQLFRYRGGEGGECATFEQELSSKLNCKHSLLVSQGTGALICGLVGIDVGPGDEVIVPAYTFMASALAVVAVGAVPIIAEVDESLTLDPADVARKITRRTKAIMPVHMHGLPSNMRALKRVANKHKVKIIEDACQAVGGSYKGKRLTTIGDIGAFSFNHFKVISCGEGGAVITSNKQAYHKALIHSDGGCAFRGHDLSADIFCGWAHRASEFQGAVMRVQLRRLDKILARLRSRKKAVYTALAGSDSYRMNPINCSDGECAVTTAILLDDEARMRKAVAALKEAGISAGSPIDSGLHVYSRWEPILKRQGSSHRRRDAFKLAGKKYRYSKSMCPNTTRILSATLCIGTCYESSVAENRAAAKKARAVLEGCLR